MSFLRKEKLQPPTDTERDSYVSRGESNAELLLPPVTQLPGHTSRREQSTTGNGFVTRHIENPPSPNSNR